jgi:hypothetical protein
MPDVLQAIAEAQGRAAPRPAAGQPAQGAPTPFAQAWNDVSKSPMSASVAMTPASASPDTPVVPAPQNLAATIATGPMFAEQAAFAAAAAAAHASAASAPSGAAAAPVPATPAPAPPPAAKVFPSGKQTMMGVAPTDLAAQIAAAQASAAAGPNSAQGAQGQAQQPSAGGRVPPANRTMLGVAMPGIAPTGGGPLAAPGQGPQSASGQALSGGQGQAPQGAPGRLPPTNRTMLGVAIPGIAPTGAAPAPTVDRSPSPNIPLPAVVPAPAPMADDEPIPPPPPTRSNRGIPVVAAVGFSIGLLLCGGAAVWLLYGQSASLVVKPSMDENSKDVLQISCPTCPDGTTLGIGKDTAKVTAGTGVLPLARALSVGDNRFSIHVDRPGAGRDEDVSVTVPVAYRIRGDLTTLQSVPSLISFRVEVGTGTQVELDGKPVAIDAAGRGVYTVDVTELLSGPADDTKTLERQIPFVVRRPKMPEEKGMVFARTRIAPLHVDAPLGSTTVAEPSFLVAGQTSPGAKVTLDGRPIVVDDKGAFAHTEAGLAAENEVTYELVAQAENLAPRRAKVKVRHTASLEQRAKTLLAEGPLPWKSIVEGSDADLGKLSVVEGEVLKAQPGPGQTLLLIENRRGCEQGSACVVRVVHAGKLATAEKQTVTVYGRLGKPFASTGTKVPELHADFLLEKRP